MIFVWEGESKTKIRPRWSRMNPLSARSPLGGVLSVELCLMSAERESMASRSDIEERSIFSALILGLEGCVSK